MPKEQRHIQRLFRRLKREGRVEACCGAGVSGYRPEPRDHGQRVSLLARRHDVAGHMGDACVAHEAAVPARRIGARRAMMRAAVMVRRTPWWRRAPAAVRGIRPAPPKPRLTIGDKRAQGQ